MAGNDVVQFELGDIARLISSLNDIGRKALPKAGARTLNRAATSSRSVAVREVAREMGLVQKRVRDQTKITKATPNKLFAVVSAKGGPIALIHFAAREVKRGVTARAWGKRKLYPGTFIGRTKTRKAGGPLTATGGKQVFRRVSKSRLPIRKLWGPSVPKTMALDVIARAWESKASETIRKRLPRELRREVDRILRRRRR